MKPTFKLEFRGMIPTFILEFLCMIPTFKLEFQGMIPTIKLDFQGMIPTFKLEFPGMIPTFKLKFHKSVPVRPGTHFVRLSRQSSIKPPFFIQEIFTFLSLFCLFYLSQCHLICFRCYCMFV